MKCSLLDVPAPVPGVRLWLWLILFYSELSFVCRYFHFLFPLGFVLLHHDFAVVAGAAAAAAVDVAAGLREQEIRRDPSVPLSGTSPTSVPWSYLGEMKTGSNKWVMEDGTLLISSVFGLTESLTCQHHVPEHGRAM